MIAHETTFETTSHGKGKYVASASSEASLSGASDPKTKHAFYAFDRVIDNGRSGWDASHWRSDELETEAWIRLDMPERISLVKYVLYAGDQDAYAQSDFPDAFVVEGSNDGTKWTTLDERTNAADGIVSAFERREYFLVHSSSYSKLRLRVTEVRGGDHGRVVVLPQLEFHGVRLGLDSIATTFLWIVFGTVAVVFTLIVIVVFLRARGNREGTPSGPP